MRVGAASGAKLDVGAFLRGKKVSFKPNGFESSGRVVYPTPHGDIEVQWGGGKEAKIKLPEGVALAE